MDNIDRDDLIDIDTGKIYSTAFDHNLCLPMVEMSGKARIYRVDNAILYILNRSNSLKNEGSSRLNEQKIVESKIRSGKVYTRL